MYLLSDPCPNFTILRVSGRVHRRLQEGQPSMSLQRKHSMFWHTPIVLATVFVLLNLVVDVLYAYVNPKIRYS